MEEKQTRKKKAKKQTNKLDLAVGEMLWRIPAPSRGDGGNGVANVPVVCVCGGEEEGRRGEEGRFFFFLFCYLSLH